MTNVTRRYLNVPSIYKIGLKFIYIEYIRSLIIIRKNNN